MTVTLIIPGLGGSCSNHWQTWWLKTDPSAIWVGQDDWSAADPYQWDVTIVRHLREHPGANIVAHSLGATAIARVAARWPSVEIGTALLVAPADVERGIGAQRLGHFGPLPRERFEFNAAVVASRNDPWMTFDRAGRLADDWGARLIDLGPSGHINPDAGFGPWPVGKTLLTDLSLISRYPAGRSASLRRRTDDGHTVTSNQRRHGT
ncbi:RBBP9/YdeN family alpha/beta hydrolase [Pannonibacter sp. Q-1]